MNDWQDWIKQENILKVLEEAIDWAIGQTSDRVVRQIADARNQFESPIEYIFFSWWCALNDDPKNVKLAFALRP
jgi:hypothetical protein